MTAADLKVGRIVDLLSNESDRRCVFGVCTSVFKKIIKKSEFLI